MRVAIAIELTDEERARLVAYVRGATTPHRLVKRARVVLLAADGMVNKDIAAEVGMARGPVGRWRKRFAEQRLPGIEKDAPRPGNPSPDRAELTEKILEATTQTEPEHATHWSTRTLAEELGVSDTRVARVWRAHGLQPHRVKTFKVSNDPHFAEKVRDVVGLYLDPPQRAIVLSVDEKTQVQALDRTQKGLPIHPGKCGTRTHDYKRNGTTTLFAALNVAEGIVIDKCMKRHRHQEWIRFLKEIDARTPSELDLHLIADNYATHKHPAVLRWLKRHPRFHMHFIPTSSSWLNLVEWFFADLTTKRLRRGSFRNVPELVRPIGAYVEHHNDTTEGFEWTKTADSFLAKVARAKATLDKIMD
ncbi:IS630 family transposase [Botrimarina hoheduenensis]|uniref:Integrase core domain protein n=1 Tax=Botrimarina hoheduenensis TaxID=2528000 RepID=A0A5C5VQV8_9BACT|nr:IS630 family transposase [Botrimarina hoheduenensis]TWT40039.1 Integrase core domain protein [Botrimarina hoheduenensis]